MVPTAPVAPTTPMRASLRILALSGAVLATDIGATSVDLDDDIAKVSLVGAGMKSHPGVAADMFEALAEAGINLEIISTSSIRVSCVVRASFNESEGTRIVEEGDLMLEKAILSGVTHDVSEAKATIVSVPDSPGIAARVFRALADAGVNIDMIVQNVSEHGHATISFTMPKTDLAVAEPILQSTARELGARRVETDPDIAKVSLIGAGMKSHPGVAADMFDALAETGINLEIISTSSIRVSCVVRAAEVERAVHAVHERFGLGDA